MKKCLDEIFQSVVGKTVMTTELKLIPNNVNDFSCKIHLIECVSYIIKNAKVIEEETGSRMIKTPWCL